MIRIRRHILLFLLMSTYISLAFAQTNNCNSKLDSTDVIRIARKKNAYPTKDWQFKPRLKFDDLTCEWTVTSGKIQHTERGDCKYTNGCTVITTTTLVINATTRKVVHREQQKQVTHNYE